MSLGPHNLPTLPGLPPLRYNPLPQDTQDSAQVEALSQPTYDPTKIHSPL
jgi:hypothetical protein